LLTLGLLAAVSVLASEMPRLAAWTLAPIALACSVRMAVRELRRPGRSFTIFLQDSRATVDGAAITDFDARWRGSLALLQWRDPGGDRVRLQCWPDTLPAGRRRELRLAMIARAAAPAAGSMAP